MSCRRVGRLRVTSEWAALRCGGVIGASGAGDASMVVVAAGPRWRFYWGRTNDGQIDNTTENG